MRAATLLLAATCLLALAGGVEAASPPSGFIDTTAVNGLSNPTSMAWDATGARLFVTQQGGDLRVVKQGALLGTPFVSLGVDSNGERGLLGVALDPDFAGNHFLYVYYTVPGSPPHNRVSRFTALGDVAAPGSEQVLLDLNNLSGATNHNGGALHFGGDGKLYVAVGENANSANAQTLGNLLGKLLRMSSDGSIPTDNPFFGTASGKNRLIWAYGLRNPFTFAVQPGTGRIFVNDVGNTSYEEIDDGIAGSNYGWPPDGPQGNPSFRDPLFCYRHSTSATGCASTSLTGCAIAGGDFYNPPVASFPAQYVGRYFFSDLCTGFIAQLDPGNGNAVSDFADGAANPVDIDTGPDGSLYYLERGGGGRVGRISYVSAPTVSTFAPASGGAGTKVTIDGTYLAGATAVAFNGTPAAFKVVWDTRIVATVPAGATSGTIAVTTGAGAATSAASFAVVPSPSISSFDPVSGPVGTSVTIHGLNLTGATAVKFHGTDAQSFTVDSGVQITAVVGGGTTSGTISVTGPGGTGTSAGSFNVTPPGPSISSFTPAGGAPGTKVTINGSRFRGATAVKFHGTNAKHYTVASNAKIIAVVKTGTTSGTITVTTPGGTATSAATFTVPSPPSISSISPSQGHVGDTVTLTGSGFTGATAVKFHGRKAKSFVVDSDSKIRAVVRAGTRSGSVTVTTRAGKGTSAGSFTVLP